jgi:ATP-dependent exoDNAse (exonuclease V) alpha subunit
MNAGLWLMAQADASMQRSRANNLEIENDSLKKELDTAKELLKYYYSRFYFEGSAESPVWKVKEDSEKLLKNENVIKSKDETQLFYPSKYGSEKYKGE